MSVEEGVVYVDAALLPYFASIAEALEKVKAHKVWYGEYHVDHVKVFFEGTETGYEIGLDPDHDTYALKIVNPDVRKDDAE